MTLTLQEHNLIIDNQLLLIENQLYRLSEEFERIKIANSDKEFMPIDIKHGKEKSKNFIIKFLQIIKEFLVNVVSFIIDLVDNLFILIIKLITKIKAKHIKKLIKPTISISGLDSLLASYIAYMTFCKNKAKNGEDVPIVDKHLKELEYKYHIYDTQSVIDGLEYLNKLGILSKKVKEYVTNYKKEIEKLKSDLSSNKDISSEEFKNKRNLFKIAKTSINNLGYDYLKIIKYATLKACHQIFTGEKYKEEDIITELNELSFDKENK